MKRFQIALAVAAVTLMTAGASFAGEQSKGRPVHQGGVKITGKVDFDSTNKDNTNYAKGENNVAIQTNGSIVGNVSVSGSLDFDSYNTDNTNYAQGEDNVAVQLNGSIVGANPFVY
jgi:hypothetical protein